MRAEGYAVFTEDEAAIQTQQNPNYGWRPTGGRETSKTTFSTRSIRMFGAMSKDRLIISIVDSANSESFQEFLEEIRWDHPKFYMVLDTHPATSQKLRVSGLRRFCISSKTTSLGPKDFMSLTRLCTSS